MLGLLFGLGYTLWLKKQKKTTTEATVPNYASSSVINAIDQSRRSIMRKKGRSSTNVTGGLSTSGTLGGASLWGA